MANLLSMPSISVGLMGRRNQPQGNDLSFLQQLMRQSEEAAQFDAGDAYFTNPAGRPAGNGVPVLENGAVGYVPPTPGAAPAQRERVSALNVLFRGLAPNLSGALDSERARLQAEADRPEALARAAENERIARALGPQALLAFRTNGAELGKSLGQQYAPQVVAEGSGLAIPGQGSFAVNERKAVVGDRVVGLGGNGQAPRELLTVTPSYDEETKRINATNPVTVAQDARLVDPYSGNVIAEGLSRPDIQNVAPGGTALAFDASGNVINSVASAQERPQSAAALKRADDIELALTADQNSIARVERALASITDPDGKGGQSAPVRVGPWENFGAGLLNASGNSNANSLGIAGIKTTVESLRQGILNDATGPQTEGDALRALDSILAGINDPKVIQQGFNDYLTAKRNTAAVRQSQLDRLRSGGPDSSGAVARPTSAAEYQALPSGTLFMAPDGSTRRKP